MAFSLFLMLASETYCKSSGLLLPIAITQLFRSWYVTFVGLVYDLILCVPVYKLVRFYEPSSEAQYETTRGTLTVFSEYFVLPDSPMCRNVNPWQRLCPFFCCSQRLVSAFDVTLTLERVCTNPKTLVS